MICINCNNKHQTAGSGETLFDVRNVNDINKGSLPDVKNVPLADLPLHAQQYLNKNEPVLICCQAGHRAIIAEKILLALGFTDITNIGNNYQHQPVH